MIEKKPRILHVCNRDILRPLRDQILRVSGYEVDSTETAEDASKMVREGSYDLLLVDIAGDIHVQDALDLCAEVKETLPKQPVAFACNWRVAVDSDCPDEVIRSEFNPEAFVKGVQHLLPPNGK